VEIRDRINSIEFAINNEIREREFYLKNARASVNPVSRATFEVLADEELEHIERLKELHETLSLDGCWPENFNLTIRASRISAVLSDLVNKYKEVFDAEPETLDAIRTAIESEAESAKFYLRLRDMVENPMEREFFGRLAEVEMDHCRALKNTEQFLADPEVWSRLKDESPG
jgi:rubrerythrin